VGREIAGVLLRTAVGGTMIAHGVKHGRSLEGTAGWFGSIGFRQPKLQAQASAAVEIGSGVMLLAGAGTPLAAAAVVGTMGVAARSVHVPNGFWITNEGWEYVTNLATAAAVGVNRRLTGGQRAAIAAGGGLLGAAAQLAVFWRKPE
jgi:putative oxidoreductase